MTSKNTICLWYERAGTIGNRPLLFSETLAFTSLVGRKCLKYRASPRVFLELNGP